MTYARLKNENLAHILNISVDDARVLRRAQLTLHRWAERECNEDIETRPDGSAWLTPHYGVGPGKPRRIANMEAGALKRVANVCRANGLHYHHQTDPRGCALYVSREPLTDTDYNRGTPCL